MSNRRERMRQAKTVGWRSLARGTIAVLLGFWCATAGCTLERPRVAVERTGAVAWEYAGLDGLAPAQLAADTRGVLVLVGLSGSPG